MKYLKFSFLSILFLLGFLITWYAANRLLSNSGSVRTYQVRPFATSSVELNNFSFKVAGFNIAHARGVKLGASNWQDGSVKELQEHLDRIALQINKQDSDVIVLNEVDFRSEWSHGINQAEYIAKKAGYSHVAEPES